MAGRGGEGRRMRIGVVGGDECGREGRGGCKCVSSDN